MEQTKIIPELASLEMHFARLIERAARESATGALRHGLHEIAQLVANHPEMALRADALLTEQGDVLAANVAVGNGVQVSLALARILDAIRPGPESSDLNRTHHPAAAPAPRRNDPALEVKVTSTGAITFAPVPAPNEKHDDE